MWNCHYCEGRFEEPEIFYETHGQHRGPYEKFEVCPFCGGGDFTQEEEEE